MLKSQRVNESASLSAAHLMTPGLWTWTGHITVNQGAALQTHVGRQYTSTLCPFFFLPCSRFVFPSIQSNDMAGVFITLCVDPVSLHVSSLSLHETKRRLLLWNNKCVLCIVWNKTGKNGNLAEMLCRSLFVRFWVICLFMCAGTPRQWNNDMSLQVACRIFLGFWRGLRGKVYKGVSLVCGWFRGLCRIASFRTVVSR